MKFAIFRKNLSKSILRLYGGLFLRRLLPTFVDILMKFGATLAHNFLLFFLEVGKNYENLLSAFNQLPSTKCSKAIYANSKAGFRFLGLVGAS